MTCDTLFRCRETPHSDVLNQHTAPATSELVLNAPAGPWAGASVEVVVDRGYIATAVGEGDREVLSQVTFRGEDFAAMEPGTVYTNDTDPDARELVGRSAEGFTADVCSRGLNFGLPLGQLETLGDQRHSGPK